MTAENMNLSSTIAVEDARGLKQKIQFSHSSASFIVRRAAAVLRALSVGPNLSSHPHPSICRAVIPATAQRLSKGKCKRLKGQEKKYYRAIPEENANVGSSDVTLDHSAQLPEKHNTKGVSADGGLISADPEWSAFLQAVIKKDYAVGYLLMNYIGLSTLALSSLLVSILGRSQPKFVQLRPLMRNKLYSGTSSHQKAPPDSPPPFITPFLTALGMSKASISKVLDRVHLSTQLQWQQLLQETVSSVPALSKSIASGHRVPAAPTNKADKTTSSSETFPEENLEDDIPMYSGVTEEALPSRATTLASNGDEQGGGSGNGSGGSSDLPYWDDDGDEQGNNGVDELLARWAAWLQQQLLQLLPAAMSLSLVLPPAGCTYLIRSLISTHADSKKSLNTRAASSRGALGLPALPCSSSPSRRSTIVNSVSARPLSHDLTVHEEIHSGEAVLELNSRGLHHHLLASWPASWLPQDGICPTPDTYVMTQLEGSYHPQQQQGSQYPASTAWLQSAAGPPLPASELAALSWLSQNMGTSPSLVASSASLLLTQLKKSQQSEACVAAHAVAELAVEKAAFAVSIKEERTMFENALQDQALMHQQQLQDAEFKEARAASHAIVSVAVAKAIAAEASELHAYASSFLAASSTPANPPRSTSSFHYAMGGASAVLVSASPATRDLLNAAAASAMRSSGGCRRITASSVLDMCEALSRESSSGGADGVVMLALQHSRQPMEDGQQGAILMSDTCTPAIADKPFDQELDQQARLALAGMSRFPISSNSGRDEIECVKAGNSALLSILTDVAYSLEQGREREAAMAVHHLVQLAFTKVVSQHEIMLLRAQQVVVLPSQGGAVQGTSHPLETADVSIQAVETTSKDNLELLNTTVRLCQDLGAAESLLNEASCHAALISAEVASVSSLCDIASAHEALKIQLCLKEEAFKVLSATSSATEVMLKADIHELQGKLETALSTMEFSNTRIASLQLQLNASCSLEQQLQADLNSAHCLLKETRCQNVAAQEAQQQLHQDLVAAQDKEACLQSELVHYKQILLEESEQASVSESEMATQKRRRHDATLKLEASLLQLIQADKDMDAKTHAVSSHLVSQLMSATSQLYSATISQDGLQSKWGSLVEDACSIVSQRDLDLHSHLMREASVSQWVAQLDCTMDHFQHQYQEAADAVAGVAKGRLDIVQRLCTELDERVEGLNSEVVRVSAELAAERSERYNLEQQHEALSLSHGGLRAQHTALVQDLDTLTTQHASLVQEYDSLTAQHTSLVQVHSVLDSQHATMGQEAETLTLQYATVVQDLDALTTKHGSLFQDHVALTAQNASLLKVHDALTAEHDSLIQIHGTLTEQHTNLSQDLSALATEHASLLLDHGAVITQQVDIEASAKSLQEAESEYSKTQRDMTLLNSKLVFEIDQACQQLDLMQIERIELLQQHEEGLSMLEKSQSENSSLLRHQQSLTLKLTALAVRGQELRGQVSNELEGQLRGQVSNELEGRQVSNELEGQLRGQVSNELEGQLLQLQSEVQHLRSQTAELAAENRAEALLANVCERSLVKMLVEGALWKCVAAAEVHQLQLNLLQLTTGFETYVLASPVSFTSVGDDQVQPYVMERHLDEVASADDDGWGSTEAGCVEPQAAVEAGFSSPSETAYDSHPDEHGADLSSLHRPLSDKEALINALINQVTGMQAHVHALQEEMVWKQETLAAGPTPMELAELAALSGGRLSARLGSSWKLPPGSLATPAGSRLAISSKDHTPSSQISATTARPVGSAAAGAFIRRDSLGLAATHWPDMSYLFTLADTALLTARAEGAAAMASGGSPMRHRLAHQLLTTPNSTRESSPSQRPMSPTALMTALGASSSPAALSRLGRSPLSEAAHHHTSSAQLRRLLQNSVALIESPFMSASAQHQQPTGQTANVSLQGMSPSRPVHERVDHLQNCMEQMMQMLSLARKKLEEAQPGNIGEPCGGGDDTAVDVMKGGMAGCSGEDQQQQQQQLEHLPQELRQELQAQINNLQPPETTPTSDKRTKHARNSSVVNPLYIPFELPGTAAEGPLLPKPSGDDDGLIPQPCTPRHESSDSCSEDNKNQQLAVIRGSDENTLAQSVIPHQSNSSPSVRRISSLPLSTAVSVDDTLHHISSPAKIGAREGLQQAIGSPASSPSGNATLTSRSPRPAARRYATAAAAGVLNTGASARSSSLRSSSTRLSAAVHSGPASSLSHEGSAVGGTSNALTRSSSHHVTSNHKQQQQLSEEVLMQPLHKLAAISPRKYNKEGHQPAPLPTPFSAIAGSKYVPRHPAAPQRTKEGVGVSNKASAAAGDAQLASSSPSVLLPKEQRTGRGSSNPSDDHMGNHYNSITTGDDSAGRAFDSITTRSASVSTDFDVKSSGSVMRASADKAASRSTSLRGSRNGSLQLGGNSPSSSPKLAKSVSASGPLITKAIASLSASARASRSNSRSSASSSLKAIINSSTLKEDTSLQVMKAGQLFTTASSTVSLLTTAVGEPIAGGDLLQPPHPVTLLSGLAVIKESLSSPPMSEHEVPQDNPLLPPLLSALPLLNSQQSSVYDSSVGTGIVVSKASQIADSSVGTGIVVSKASQNADSSVGTGIVVSKASQNAVKAAGNKVAIENQTVDEQDMPVVKHVTPSPLLNTMVNTDSCSQMPLLQQVDEPSFVGMQNASSSSATSIHPGRHYEHSSRHDPDHDAPKMTDDGTVSSQVFSSSPEGPLMRDSPAARRSQHMLVLSSSTAATGGDKGEELESYRAQPISRFGCGMIPRFRSKPRKHFDSSYPASEASLSSLHDLVGASSVTDLPRDLVGASSVTDLPRDLVGASSVTDLPRDLVGASSVTDLPRDSVEGVEQQDRRTWPTRTAVGAEAFSGSSSSDVRLGGQAALEGDVGRDEGIRSVDEVAWASGVNSMLASGPSVDLSSASAMTCPPLEGYQCAEAKPKKSLSQRITRKISKIFMG
ncbi:hypothetical protein CEUSTIGMA_g11106.t1 [Chlamydomonas eustigma]|uniref:Uncharacterized protein n=1 Tax=Chlamydomonas eustigma TaxID=1157962 RepID=A0A250XKR1_9CHLO|nr:hypothetical protein CEUSTIGMA_g11106.t1 [Chlamydomonas eustigma]|eukprot:GAX83681.1 hypothetical protein CEUSTIGMA_g11106.t1 [Chlamydomonas eustigma]